MNSSKKRIGTQSSMGPVGFEPFYKVGPVNIFFIVNLLDYQW
jgi:hypothetical protein